MRTTARRSTHLPPDSAPKPYASSSGWQIYLGTFGCQMNELVSELVQGHATAIVVTTSSTRQIAIRIAALSPRAAPMRHPRPARQLGAVSVKMASWHYGIEGKRRLGT